MIDYSSDKKEPSGCYKGFQTVWEDGVKKKYPCNEKTFGLAMAYSQEEVIKPKNTYRLSKICYEDSPVAM